MNKHHGVAKAAIAYKLAVGLHWMLAHHLHVGMGMAREGRICIHLRQTLRNGGCPPGLLLVVARRKSTFPFENRSLLSCPMKPISPWPRKPERLSRFHCGRFAHHKVRRNGYLLLAFFRPLDPM